MSSINLNDASNYDKRGQMLGHTITMLAWDMFDGWVKSGGKIIRMMIEMITIC